MRCCSNAITAWHHWFQPARLCGWSCNTQASQPVGAEGVAASSHIVHGGTQVWCCSCCTVVTPGCHCLVGTTVGGLCMEDVGFVSQLQLATCPALGEVTHVQLLAGVSELLGHIPSERSSQCWQGKQLLLAWPSEPRCLSLPARAWASSPAWLCGCGIN